MKKRRSVGHGFNSKTACSNRKKPQKRTAVIPSRTMSPEFASAVTAGGFNNTNYGTFSNMLLTKHSDHIFSPLNKNHVSTPSLARFSKMPKANKTFLKPGWLK